MASIESLTNEYFKSMNGLAEKISNDLTSTREAYQELWFELSSEEQKQVLNEAIIDPAAVLKYDGVIANNTNFNENRSSDFSWFTKSQLNLFTVSSLRGEKFKSPIKKTDTFSPAANIRHSDHLEIDNKNRNHNETNLLNKLKSRVPVLKSSSNEEKQNLVENRNQINLTPKTLISKPKTPPPPPPTKPNIHNEKRALLSTDNESDHSEDIPKTGFDFLDNW